jgi:surfactin synthase thioesterase subunit
MGQDTWLRRFAVHPNGNRAGARLVILPHAGGSAGNYRELAALLSDRMDVLCVQYPGRQDRYAEKPIADLRVLAEQVAEPLSILDHRPLLLFGHSMGALVGFEVARILECAGLGPSRLFVSARRAPSLDCHERLHQADDDSLLGILRELGGVDSDLIGNEKLLRFNLPAVRADYQAIETYRCEQGVTVDCPITALAGEDDERVPIEDVSVWGKHTTGDFAMATFRGGHFFINDYLNDVAGLLCSMVRH